MHANWDGCGLVSPTWIKLAVDTAPRVRTDVPALGEVVDWFSLCEKLRLVSRGLYYAGVRSTTGVLVRWTEVRNWNYIGRSDEGIASQKTAMMKLCT